MHANFHTRQTSININFWLVVRRRGGNTLNFWAGVSNVTQTQWQIQTLSWGGLNLLALLAFFPSVISSFFYPKYEGRRGGGGGWVPPLDLPLPITLSFYHSMFSCNSTTLAIL